MRRFFHAVGTIIVVLASALCVLFVYALSSSPAFQKGERYEFYLGASSSSKIVCSENPSLDKLLLGDVAGESVRYESGCAEELLLKYNAEILFTEEVSGIVNYYCSSPCFTHGVALNGYCVNLHIASDGERTAAGTPLIFGGF